MLSQRRTYKHFAIITNCISRFLDKFEAENVSTRYYCRGGHVFNTNKTLSDQDTNQKVYRHLLKQT